MIHGGWALLLGASLLAGCGLKGSLKLPEKPGDVEIRPAPGAPATSEQPAIPPTGTPSE
jgi:predicted small lipoprotein YifL